MKRYIIPALCVMLASSMFAIEKIQLLSHEEYHLEADSVLHLPGLGLGLRCGPDSLLLLDNPELATVRWVEPMNPRSIVACGSQLYAAQGDSIFRVAINDTPRKFIGRLDNDQFTLHQASDSTFFALTADEDFSCVYEIDPNSGTCTPFFSVQAALLKIAPIGENVLLWVDDQLILAFPDGTLAPLFVNDTLSDMVYTPMGIMAATAEGLWWITQPGKGGKLIADPVSNVWWDENDVLYYLTTIGDLNAIIGAKELFVSQNPELQ